MLNLCSAGTRRELIQHLSAKSWSWNIFKFLKIFTEAHNHYSIYSRSFVTKGGEEYASTEELFRTHVFLYLFFSHAVGQGISVL